MLFVPPRGVVIASRRVVCSLIQRKHSITPRGGIYLYSRSPPGHVVPLTTLSEELAATSAGPTDEKLVYNEAYTSKTSGLT